MPTLAQLTMKRVRETYDTALVTSDRRDAVATRAAETIKRGLNDVGRFVGIGDARTEAERLA